jgi:hypothetical protein
MPRRAGADEAAQGAAGEGRPHAWGPEARRGGAANFVAATPTFDRRGGRLRLGALTGMEERGATA